MGRGLLRRWVLWRGARPPVGSGAGGEGQPDNKSPVRAMASGGLFSASVGREGGSLGMSSRMVQITSPISTSPGSPSAFPRCCALHSSSGGHRKQINHFFQLKCCPRGRAPLSCLHLGGGARRQAEKLHLKHAETGYFCFF